MKAICVTPNRELEVRDIPTPNTPAPGHLLIDMEASPSPWKVPGIVLAAL